MCCARFEQKGVISSKMAPRHQLGGGGVSEGVSVRDSPNAHLLTQLLYSLPAWHHFCLLLACAPLFTHLFTHPLYSAPYSASPLRLLTPVIPLTNPLQVADQFLTQHLVNFVYKSIGPPVYKPAAKGCKRVSAWPSIYILIFSVTASPPFCLWTCRSLVLA